MTRKSRIIMLYYERKKSVIEIAYKLKVSKQYVSRIIKNDERYLSEKKARKEKSKERRQMQKRDYARRKREKSKNEVIDAVMDILHAQASFELSGRKTINNRAYRNWNSSIYEYHKKTKEYRVKENMKNKVSYAVPQKIKWD